MEMDKAGNTVLRQYLPSKDESVCRLVTFCKSDSDYIEDTDHKH